MIKKLRPYQQNIVDVAVRSDRDFCICLPTGAGKTVIANAIMENLSTKAVFIVPRLELIAQARNEFGDVDIVWADKTEITGKKITIASKDSLRSQFKQLKFGQDEPITLIFDEAHVGIKQTSALVEAFRHNYTKVRVLGLTATPERMDGLALLKGSNNIHKYGVFDEVLQEETVSSLIDKQYLAPLHYYAKPIEGITDVKPDSSLGEELSGEQMTQIFNENGIWGDLVECYEKYAIVNGKKRPAIGFTVTVAMAEKVADVFNSAGYNFKVIHGEMNVRERRELIEALRTGAVDGLVNAALLTYGFDCPPVSYAFSCRHVKSRPLWFQMVGRILRTYPGKTDAIFIDHGDSISEFSEPNNPLPILAPVMDWRADGEDKDLKKERKKRMKKAQDTMKLIQELAPLPADMVEVTVEDTYTRLIHAVQNLQRENGSLRKTVEFIQAENARLAREKDKAVIAAKSAAKPKVIDRDKTFEYVKKNYCKVRRTLFSQYSADQQHRLTVDQLRKDGEKLDFYLDTATFQEGISYWKSHYKADWTYGGSKPASNTTNNNVSRNDWFD